MRRTLVALSLAATLLSLRTAAAQVPPGTIAVTGLFDTQFSLFDPVNSVFTPYALTNTTGSGTANTSDILFDVVHANSFILGGEGFIGRVTITGPGTSTYTLITNQVGIIAQMSWDANKQLVVVDSTSSQVVRVDPGSGNITPISVGPQPWGADANAGAIDPATGDIFVGANKALYVLKNGTTTAVPLSSGWTTGNFAFCTGVAFDPFTSDLFVSILTADRIVRMNRTTGAITDLIPPHSIQSCNGIAVDGNGDMIVVGWQNSVNKIPNGGGTKTLLGNAQGQGILASGVAVAATACGGSATNYGTGCAGKGGIVPTMQLDGCPEANGLVTLSIDQGLGGATFVTVFGLAQAAAPIGGGCKLLVTPLLAPMLSFVLGGAPGAAGAGSIQFPGFIPPVASGLTFTMQTFVVDPANWIGASSTNGIQVHVN